MTRLLALFFLVWAVFHLVDSQVRRLSRGLGDRRRRVARDSTGSGGTMIRQAGELVPCAGCGVHVARPKAIAQDGTLFCSERCARRR